MTRFTFSDYTRRLREFIQRSAPKTAPSRGGSSTIADSIFDELAVELFGLQFAFNEPYRHFCERRGVLPAKVALWTQIPAIPTSAFKELTLTSLAPAERTSIFHSSGTTDQNPSCNYHDAESTALYETSLLPWFEAHLLSDRPWSRREMRMIFLTPNASLAPRSSLVHMFETVRRDLAAPTSLFTGQLDSNGAWVLNARQAQIELANAVGANRPVTVLGTAFNFVHLLDHLAECNVRFALPPGSRALETGGYKGRSRFLIKRELHSLITEYLGIPAENIVCEYGMCELSSQAYDKEVTEAEVKVQNGERVFRFPPWARGQVVSPETGREMSEGETGLIRVVDLANVRSVLAVQTEDLGTRRGAGFELLGRAELAEPRGCSRMVG